MVCVLFYLEISDQIQRSFVSSFCNDMFFERPVSTSGFNRNLFFNGTCQRLFNFEGGTVTPFAGNFNAIPQIRISSEHCKVCMQNACLKLNFFD